MSELEWRERSRRVLHRCYPSFAEGSGELLRSCPWFYVSGQGARLYAENGEAYLDLEMERGPNILGYGHPVIRAAIEEHAKLGVQTAMFHRFEVEVAETLVELIPCAEQVVFAKNGSDVCAAAVRLARTVTGRELILSSGFHGFHDWYVADHGWPNGFPNSWRGFVKDFELNDFDTLRKLTDECGRDVAGIIIEPAHRHMPAPGFLEAVRDLANQWGALLIFDEVVTAFRLHMTGAQGLFGVMPDLTCLGKAMGNGYPISALVGRKDVMKHLGETFFSMTYQHDSLGFAVARACLSYLRDNEVTGLISARTNALKSVFNEAAIAHEVPARVLGSPGRLDFDFPPIGELSSVKQAELFCQVLLESHVLPATSAFPCEQLSEADIAQAGEAFRLAMRRIRESLR